MGLLAHENTDIAIAVCELLEELTDEDSGAEEEQWKVLVDAMMESDVIDLLISNLSRLDESNETDRSGVYHVLSVIENLLSESKATEGFGANKKMLDWLKERIAKPDAEARAKVGQNRQYAAEILAILLQGNEKNRQRFAEMDGMDTLLQLLSAYRKRDPEKESDEEEFVENLFDCLVAVVKDTTGAEKFLENEGVELCLIMLREGKLSKLRALRVLDHALGGQQAGIVGDRFIEAAGLKTVFGMFMKSKKQDRETNEHIIGIFASLLRYLPADSAPRIRLLAKFVEKKYEKIGKLAELKQEYSVRVDAVDTEIKAERQGLSQEVIEDLEPEWLSRRFDAGLFTVQTLDVIMAWLAAEDDGARQKLEQLLTKSGTSALNVLQESLREQLDGLDPDTGKETKEMLEALLRCLV